MSNRHDIIAALCRIAEQHEQVAGQAFRAVHDEATAVQTRMLRLMRASRQHNAHAGEVLLTSQSAELQFYRANHAEISRAITAARSRLDQIKPVLDQRRVDLLEAMRHRKAMQALSQRTQARAKLAAKTLEQKQQDEAAMAAYSADAT